MTEPYTSPALRVSTGGPCCAVRYAVDVHLQLQGKPLGTYSLAGAQVKVSAVERWVYTCTNCGATGPAPTPVDALTGKAVTRAVLEAMPLGSCGHVMATDHYPGKGHTSQTCPGCCPACHDVRDREKGLQ